MNSKAAYDQEYFDALYALNQGDPWHYEQRWYEQRKRQICLAVLPRLQFDSAIEIGCSNGIFSQELLFNWLGSVYMLIRMYRCYSGLCQITCRNRNFSSL